MYPEVLDVAIPRCNGDKSYNKTYQSSQCLLYSQVTTSLVWHRDTSNMSYSTPLPLTSLLLKGSPSNSFLILQFS